MSYYYITFRSVTFAQRGERVLQAGRIRCTLQRTPRWMEEQGCGYCLRLWTKELTPAVELLVREGVTFRKLYVQKAQGQLEEVTL